MQRTFMFPPWMPLRHMQTKGRCAVGWMFVWKWKTPDAVIGGSGSRAYSRASWPPSWYLTEHRRWRLCTVQVVPVSSCRLDSVQPHEPSTASQSRASSKSRIQTPASNCSPTSHDELCEPDARSRDSLVSVGGLYYSCPLTPNAEIITYLAVRQPGTWVG